MQSGHSMPHYRAAVGQYRCSLRVKYLKLFEYIKETISAVVQTLTSEKIPSQTLSANLTFS